MSTGRASSRDAPRPTCPIASANAPASAVTVVPLGSCNPGKSSAGSSRSVPSYAAQRIVAWLWSVSNSTGAFDRLFTVSPSSRAGTSAIPDSVTCTEIDSRADTSRSVVMSVSSPPSAASINTPVSAGIPGRDDTPRWTVCKASESASRSHRNFNVATPCCS